MTKEIYEYLNIKSVDNVLICKLRNLLVENEEYYRKILSLKSYLMIAQEERKISI